MSLSECAGSCCPEVFKWRLHNTVFVSCISKAHWAIIERITRTHHTAFSKVALLLQITCFSKPGRRDKFLSGVFLNGELSELFQMMKNVLHKGIILHRYGTSIKVGSESLHNTPSVML